MTSFFQVAPYSGGAVFVQFRYTGTSRFIDPYSKEIG